MELRELAQQLYNNYYLENTPYLSDEELQQLLNLIIEISNSDKWLIIQDRNVESNEIWYALNLYDGQEHSSYEEETWLNYTR